MDLNQVLLSGILPQLSSKNALPTKLDETAIRYMVLNIIRMHVSKFKKEYGEVVICCDNKTYWRREYFPFYKALRKKNRESSELDWKLVFELLAKFKQELKDHFPYKVIEVELAEADDIIGTLAQLYAPTQKIIIISSDGDFLQLQRYGNVVQYNQMQKKFIKSENPILELKEKILRGDRGDGIPNVLSPSDSFVRGIKQKSMTVGIVSKLLTENDSDYEEITKNNFIRNQTLIDLTFIPENIKENIIHTYNETTTVPRKQLLNYFIQYKLKNLISEIGEF